MKKDGVHALDLSLLLPGAQLTKIMAGEGAKPVDVEPGRIERAVPGLCEHHRLSSAVAAGARDHNQDDRS